MRNKEPIYDVADSVIAEQRAALDKNAAGKGFGPQSPRDIDAVAGANSNMFTTAPANSQMNLCNIHFHIGAEHKGGEFTTYAGNGDGAGNGTEDCLFETFQGYLWLISLSATMLPLSM